MVGPQGVPIFRVIKVHTGLSTRSSLLFISGGELPLPLTEYQCPTLSFRSIDTLT